MIHHINESNALKLDICKHLCDIGYTIEVMSSTIFASKRKKFFGIWYGTIKVQFTIDKFDENIVITISNVYGYDNYADIFKFIGKREYPNLNLRVI